MGRRQIFLWRRHTNGQQTHEKMHNITQHQGKTKPQWDATSHQSEWLKLTSQEMTNVGKDAEKGKPFCAAGGNVNGCSHSGKQYGVSSKS